MLNYFNQWFEITPIDTLFFRDGRPYNKDESITLSGVKSIFPPSPATISGAILAQFARILGWNGYDDWEDGVKNILGVNDDINLEFSGVLLKRNDEILFPVPQHLVNCINDEVTAKNLVLNFLIPSTDTYHTDMGQVHLPTPKQNNVKIKPLKNYWITQSGLIDCLKLKIPPIETLYCQEKLWEEEHRIGLDRDIQTRSAKQGMLYSPTHIRLKKGVSIIMGVKSNIDNKVNHICPLGGEARMANISSISSPAFDLLTKEKGNLIYTASPTQINNPQLITNLKTACMPSLQRFGGWNSIKFEPRPLLPFLAAGTVLFLEKEITAESWKNEISKFKSNHFTQSKFGYNQFILGQY